MTTARSDALETARATRAAAGREGPLVVEPHGHDARVWVPGGSVKDDEPPRPASGPGARRGDRRHRRRGRRLAGVPRPRVATERPTLDHGKGPTLDALD